MLLVKCRPCYLWSGGHAICEVEAMPLVKCRPYHLWSVDHATCEVEAMPLVKWRPCHLWSRDHATCEVEAMPPVIFMCCSLLSNSIVLCSSSQPFWDNHITPSSSLCWQLHLYDVEEQTRTTILNYCAYVEVSGSGRSGQDMDILH